MTEIISDDELDELERLERAATLGPWIQGKDMPGGGVSAVIHFGKDHDGRSLGKGMISLIAAMPGDDGYFENEANGKLVRAMRNALPSLIAEVRRHRAHHS